MIRIPPVKKREAVVPDPKNPTDNTLVSHGVANSMQARISVAGTEGVGNDNGSGEVASTEEHSTIGIPASDTSSVKRKIKPTTRCLLPVKHKKAVGTSYAQPVRFPGHILLEERRQDKPHKVQAFSSQKMPQPFLDR